MYVQTMTYLLLNDFVNNNWQNWCSIVFNKTRKFKYVIMPYLRF